MLAAVVFDLGGVLVQVDFDRLWQRTTGGSDAGVRPERLMDTDLMTRWCTGRVPVDDFRRAVCARAGLDLDEAAFAAWWSDVFSPMPGMEALVTEVAARWPVGLLSDTDPLHWASQRDRWSFLAAIPSPTLSFRTGILKPAREAFLAAAASVGQPPERCLYVDDLPRNVDAARAAGMTAVRFEGAEALRATLSAHGLLPA